MTVVKHPKNVLHQEIALVDTKLWQPVTVYLIGGGAMSFQGLKDATKDIDGILESEADLRVLAEALEGADYVAATDLDPEYQDLSATRILTKDGAPQWDLFIKVVCKKLRLSPGMKARSSRFEGSGTKLQLRLIAPEDIFVFKSITERKGDIPDVDILWASGLDWTAILDEMTWQCAHSDQEWSGHFLETLERLAGEGRAVPILAEIRDLAERERDEWAVLHVLTEPMTVDAVVECLQNLESEDIGNVVREAIDRLVARGRLLNDDLLQTNPTWPYISI